MSIPPERPAQVLSVNTGTVRTGPWTGRVGRTGIDKAPVRRPVEVRAGGLAGDHVCDRRYHGSPDQAVYAYAREDLDRWGAALGLRLPDGAFGENLTTLGVDPNAAVVGERWRVGTALLEVASVRIPCRVFAGWMALHGVEEAGWVRRFTTEGRPGPYLRVLEQGVVEAGDPLVVEHRPDHGLTVATVFRALTTARALLPGLLVAPELAPVLRARAEAAIGGAGVAAPDRTVGSATDA